MTKKIKPIIALLVDDNSEFLESTKRSAFTKGIIFKTAHDLDEMKLLLPKIYNSIVTIVLDIKGITEKNQSVGKPDFVQAAVEVIHSNPSFKNIPICLITGDSNKLNEFKILYKKVKMFLKTPQQLENLFNQIKNNSKDLDNIKLRRKYDDVFIPLQAEYKKIKLIKKLNNIDQELMTLLQKFTEGDFSIIKDNLARIRRIQEAVFQCMKTIDERLLPKVPFTPKGNINFSEWDYHHSHHKIDDKEICSGVINLFRTPIYVLSSEDGAHVPFEESTYPPTKYTVQALTFALLDFLKWFGMLLTKYKEQKR